MLVAYGLANLLVILLLRPALNADWATAWWNLQAWGDDVYDHPWRYSPLLLPVFSVVVAAGPLVLAGAHVAAVGSLLLLKNRLTFWMVAFSAFFWLDLIVGNVFTFVAVAAAFAVAGSRAGSVIYFTLTLLMPRPVQLPLAIWLAWRRPDLRLPFAFLVALNILGLALSGLGIEWIRSLVASSELTYAPFSIGLGRLFGLGWLLVGVPIAALMVWRGNASVAAAAGVVVSPFLLPQYLLMGVVAVPGLIDPASPSVRGMSVREGHSPDQAGPAG
jgi:hypothetical protein